MDEYQDKEINYKHGELILCGMCRKEAFRFRCGPVSRWAGFSWSWCTCKQHYARGHQGRVSRASGNMRYPKTLNTLRWAEAHELEGIKVRKKGNSKKYIPTAWDDKFSTAQKCWKRYRKHQWKNKQA